MSHHHDALLAQLVEESGNFGEFIREVVERGFQQLIEAEAENHFGASRYERTSTRTNERNGHRSRTLSTAAGDLDLKIPKSRKGSFMPSLLAPRRRIDKALQAVVMEAWVNGVSTRSVDDLVKALGIESGISKSEVSRICKGLDEDVSIFRHRDLSHVHFPYVFVDATYVKVRRNHRVVSMAVVIATGVTSEGTREVLGLDVGDSEEETFWRAFFNALRARGLGGVQLVISDQHAGLVSAIQRCFQGASHQRCKVHFIRNLLARVKHTEKQMVASIFRTIFTPETHEGIDAAFNNVRDQFTPHYPDLVDMMDAAKEEILAFRHFPKPHWRKIWSTNPIERLNKEIKRRTKVIGIFPNKESVIRLVGCLLLEIHEEWLVDERRYLPKDSMDKLTNPATITPSSQPAALEQQPS